MSIPVVTRIAKNMIKALMKEDIVSVKAKYRRNKAFEHTISL